MENCHLKQCLSGVIFIIFALISDNVVQTDVNFKSRPTTIKTFENDSVLLPCDSTGTRKICFHKFFKPFCDIEMMKKYLLLGVMGKI
jgi:hypothetical protein